jgi:hypothetical protein
VALLLAGPFCFLIIGDPDPGWHLALGRLMAQSGLPHTNALTWTAPNEPWYDTSWLWDYVTYALWTKFGLRSLQWTTLFTFAIAIVAAAFAGQRMHRLGAWLCVPLALFLVPRLTVRPHVATWAGLACVLALCVYGHRRSVKWRFACAPVIALFGNMHSGAMFAAGLLGFFCLEELIRTRRPSELLAATLGGLALLANPGGLFNLRSLFWHLHVQEVVVIEEYLPPTWKLEAPFFFLLPIVLVCAFRLRKQQPALVAAAVLFGILAARSNRMIYEFAIVSMPLLARTLRPLPMRASALVIALLTIATAAGRHYLRRLRNLEVAADWDPSRLPVETARFAKEHGVRGRLFNAYDWGGYLEWAMPESPTFVDGRVQCFPPDFFPRFYKAGHSPEAFAKFLGEWDVEWAIDSRTNPWLSGKGLFEEKDWALVDWDAVSHLRLRRDVPRFKPLIAALEYKRYRPDMKILPTLAKLSEAETRTFANEALRYSKDHEGDDGAVRSLCAALIKLRDARADQACASVDPSFVKAAQSLRQ